MSKQEWFEVCREVKPDLSVEEYERMWAEFIRARDLLAAAKLTTPSPFWRATTRS